MKKEVILVVDDMEINRDILESILESEYTVVQAASGVEAINMIFSAAVMPSLVLLDIMMPEMDGLTVLAKMKENPLTARIPVIFITAADPDNTETRGLSLGAADYIAKPFNASVVKIRIANQLTIQKYQAHLEELVDQKVAELVRSKDKMLNNMANVIEYRNLESGQHVKRTSGMTRILLDFLRNHSEYGRNVPPRDEDIIVKSVPLHDIGKIAIPDNILLKPGALTKEEFEVIKTHSAIGSEIIDTMLDEEDPSFRKHCRDICRHHHERWDGRGYPDGLSGEEIPLSARILAIVDVYDALVSPRIYKLPFSHEDAVKIITESSATQFDPQLVKAFLEVQDQFESFDRVNV
ncbi:MAG: response regulator [Oscillospiraceae bacterium]|nr:response regulator [Oscillospiraceae bacterium]